MADPGRAAGKDFIRTLVDRHVAEGRYDRIVTRFPPEPNGYLHIGHAKSIVLNFGLANEYDGRCHLRFDDTNPLTEDEEYTAAIERDVRWLGYDWGEHLYHASDYFERMYEVAEGLIRRGKAYVDSASEEEIREARGTVTEPGRPTAFRDRSVDENLDLFRRMRAGEFDDGAHVLRGKIDLAHPNMIMRDPVFYRIRHAHHYRTGDDWCIYPLYDFAHCLEDAFEGVSHSLCTLEFDNNREIYDWILDEAGFEEPRTHQYEFARLNLDYTVLSKRKLIRLVREGHVAGWDDPRMPTIAGLRRRGVPPEAVRRFCEMVGVAKADSRVDMGKLEYAIRDTLNDSAPRGLAVLEPLRVVLTNWPAGKVEVLSAPRFPDRDGDEQDERELHLGRELYIEASDFSDDPPSGWKRLAPGAEVRLRYAYVIRCDEVVRDPSSGEVTELRCRYDSDTLGRNPEGRRVGGTIHWVSSDRSETVEVRLFDRLFSVPDPDDVPEGADFTHHLNPDSRHVVVGARVEPALAAGEAPERVQFERLGYFARDPDWSAERPVWNRIVTLRDGWAKKPDEPKSRPGPRREAQVATTPEERLSDEREAARQDDDALAERFRRYQDEFGLSMEEADVLTGSRALSDFFEEALASHADAPAVAAWVVNDLAGALGDRNVTDAPFGGRALGRLAALVAEGTISRRAAKDVLADMVENGGDPEAIVERRGLRKLDDRDELLGVVREVLAAWPDKVEAYRAGHHNLLGLFMGQVMKRTGGTADPQLTRTLLRESLES